MNEQLNRYQLRNRYQFKGSLVMLTALHIGGGNKYTLSQSDSPVVLTPTGVPFIPGSSFKGALRSTVEKLVPSLPASARLTSCGLPGKDEPQNPCPTAHQQSLAQWRRNTQMEKGPGAVEELMDNELQRLCNTCQLFGSPFAAAHVNVQDLYIPIEQWSGVIQVRDGVAIDRDSEKAKDRLKYDFEVVPPGTPFDLTITLENATLQDLQLISVGLSEFVHSEGVLGGLRSRGLGACRLEKLVVSTLELDNVDEAVRNRRLKNYLLNRQFAEEIEGQKFLAQYIGTLFND